MKSVATYIVCVALLVSTLCGCSTHRRLGSSKLFSRETVIAFYALAPGETSPGPLYQRVLTFAPTVVFVADASEKRGVWSMRTPAPEPYVAQAPSPVQMPLTLSQPGAAVPHLPVTDTLSGGVSAMDIGVVHVSQIVDLQRLAAAAEFRSRNQDDESASLATWRLVLLPEPLLAARVSDGFDEIARALEQHGVALALSPGEGYLRSLPVGSAAQTAVRYIALPTDSAAAPVEAPWLTPSPQGGRYAILRAAPDRLSWTLYNGEGKLLDLVTVRNWARAEGASDFLLTSEVIALMKYGNEEEPAQP